MVSDMAAFFVGRSFGKHKLAPNISPMKTVEGAIAGIIGAILTSLIINYIFAKFEIFDLNASICMFSFECFLRHLLCEKCAMYY